MVIGTSRSKQVASENYQALQKGASVPGSPYVIVRWLYQRPRLSLYLGRRIYPHAIEEAGTLVAIRELLLSGLPEQIQAQVEAAAFEEFASPGVPNAPWFSTAGDRIWRSGDRHYVVMQLQGARCDQYAQIITLDELLGEQPQWPGWLNRNVALTWGLQLCRAVANVHNGGGLLGDLHPGTILVDRRGAAPWAPLLPISWPPLPQFWHATQSERDKNRLFTDVFPVDRKGWQNVFIAPEVLYGVCDERADVYSLGAILFLLVTHYAPIAALRRLYAWQRALRAGEGAGSLVEQDMESLDFVSLRALDGSIPLALEHVLLRALNPDPDLRYDSVAALAEALQVVMREQKL